MNNDPEFVMPETPPPAPQPEQPIQAPQLTTPVATSPAKPSPTIRKNGRKNVVAGLLVGVVIGVVTASAYHQSTTNTVLPELEPALLDGQAPEPLGGIGDVEAPQSAHIVNVASNPADDSLTVEFEVLSEMGTGTYRLIATQPLAEIVTENQATAVELGFQRTEASNGETQAIKIPLDLDGTHPSLPYQVSLSQFDPNGVLQEVDAAQILLTDNCEPPEWKSDNNVYCWNSQ